MFLLLLPASLLIIMYFFCELLMHYFCYVKHFELHFCIMLFFESGRTKNGTTYFFTPTQLSGECDVL